MRLYFRGHRIRLSQKREARLARRVIFLSFLLALAVTLTASLYHKAAPIAAENAAAMTRSRWEALAITAVEKVMQEKNYTYDALAFQQVDASGNTVALTVKSEILTTLRAEVTKELTKLLAQNDRISISVPIGTLIAPRLFGGKGFGITLTAMTYSALKVAVISEVFSVGINQTMHRLSLSVTTDTTIYCINEKTTVTHTVFAPLAENLTFSSIPDSYFEYGVE